MPYDLLLRGGEVIDPANSRHGVMDVAISKGKIVAVEPSMVDAEAVETIDVRGKLVTPGLIDIHAHVFFNSYDMGEQTDRICAASGVTTVCDAGSAGSANFPGLRYLVQQSVRTRFRAFVHLSALGIVAPERAGELLNASYADPEGCAETICANRDLAIGVKLRFSNNIVWQYDTEPLRLARKAADMADVPLMVHITDSPLPLPEILNFMKPGDIVTHCLHGHKYGIMDLAQDSILKEVWDAQKNGIIFDCAHGRSGHFNFPLVRKALDHGFLPDTISSDLTLRSATHGPVFDLPTTMSKLLNFGVSIDDVVLRVTANPARAIGAAGRLGTLQPGATADVGVFDLEEGAFEFIDTDGNRITGNKRLVAALTVKDGRVWYRA